MAEIVNVDQAAAWDGEEGEEWTATEPWRDLVVRAATAELFSVAAIEPPEHVLDVGCGTGQTTREAARRASSGDALGVDLSSRMLERARERSTEEGLTNVRFEQADAQVYPFSLQSIDVVISRTGAMFFSDPVAAFANIGRATKAAGRLVLVVWQELASNEWVLAMRQALAMGRDLPTPPANVPGPFGLADPDFVRATLGAAGWDDIGLADLAAPFWFGPNADDAFVHAQAMGIVRGLLQDLDSGARAEALERLRSTLAAHATDDGVVFDSRSWVITARRAR